MTAEAKIREISAYRVPEDDELHIDIIYHDIEAPTVALATTFTTTNTVLVNVLEDMSTATGLEMED